MGKEVLLVSVFCSAKAMCEGVLCIGGVVVHVCILYGLPWTMKV